MAVVNPKITVDDQGIVTQEEWYLAGNRHRVDGPAWREWTIVDGYPILTLEAWYLAGNRHRVDGPARRMWKIVNGIPVLTGEQWWLEGERHRVGGPAWTEWVIVNTPVNGIPVLTYEGWWFKYQIHRVDGPAYRRCEIEEDGSTFTEEEWYVNDIQVVPSLLPTTAIKLQRWWRASQYKRWLGIERQLRGSGLVIWPGLVKMLRSY